MKKIASVVLVFALFMLTLSSCKKSNGENPSSSIPSMSLTFNGTAKSASTVLASLYVNENSLQVIGSFANTQALSLMIPNIKVGTFNVATGDVLATFSTSPDFADTYQGATGSVVITSYTSDAVSGTFQFTGTNQALATGVVTAGKFTAKIIKIQQ